MTNGELFRKQYPNINVEENGNCMWIYFDYPNYYTMPIEWWNDNVSVIEKIKDDIRQVVCENSDVIWSMGLKHSLKIIDKHTAESEEKYEQDKSIQK